MILWILTLLLLIWCVTFIYVLLVYVEPPLHLWYETFLVRMSCSFWGWAAFYLLIPCWSILYLYSLGRLGCRILFVCFFYLGHFLILESEDSGFSKWCWKHLKLFKFFEKLEECALYNILKGFVGFSSKSNQVLSFFSCLIVYYSLNFVACYYVVYYVHVLSSDAPGKYIIEWN